MLLTTLRARLGRHADFKAAAHDDRPGLETLKPCVPGQDCDDCPNQAHVAAAVPLCLVRPGATARVVRVAEGQRFRKRLADLGLAPGMEVRVLRASHARGPLLLGLCGDARLAVGWGMANKITVEVRD